MASDFQTNPSAAQPLEIEPPPCPAEGSEFAVTPEPVKFPLPWGPWATIGWTVLCIAVIVVAQIAALFIFVAFRFATSPSPKFDDLATNGNFLALATLLSTPAVLGLVALLIRVRRNRIRDYLALYWPLARSVLIAFVGLAAVLGATDLTSYLVGRPLVPTVMVDVYQTAWLPAFLLALVVLAPVGEETLFRGFLYKGIAASSGGPTVAIIVSSVAFALLHVQYDWYGVVGVAAIGLYLGVVRYRSGSLLLTMLLHAVANLFATLELVVQEHWLK
jgi:membrane protease YdiL (CAAX protease family)